MGPGGCSHIAWRLRGHCFKLGRPGLKSQLSSPPCPPRLHYVKVKSSWHSPSTHPDYLFPKALVLIRPAHQIFPALHLPGLWQSWILSLRWGQQMLSTNDTCHFGPRHLTVHMRPSRILSSLAYIKIVRAPLVWVPE